MAEAPKTEEDEGVELSLGLSIGGSSQKPERAIEPLKGFNTGMQAERSVVLPLFPTDVPDLHDPERKREYHALRRKEARRKQDEKLLRRGILRGRSGVIPAIAPPARTNSPKDRAVLEAQEQQGRARDRETRENEPSIVAERRSSGQKGRESIDRILEPAPQVPNSSPIPTKSPSPNPTQITVLNPTPISIVNPNPSPVSYGPPPIPVLPMHLPYQPVPFVPYGSGYAIPCMVPYWAPAVPTAQPLSSPPTNANNLSKLEGNVFHPVPHRPVVPPVHPGFNFKGAGNEQEKNSGEGALIPQVPLWASIGKSSSNFSDHHSNSNQGGSSSNSDAGTNSSSTVPEKRQNSIPGDHSDHSIPNNHASSSSATIKMVPNSGETSSMSKPNAAMSYPVRIEGTASVNKPASAAEFPKLEDPTNETEMPYVATTGDGPNGKTITGFLYSYSKGEIRIMCICHGCSFTPAEFVRHAGGTDMVHPLKHIVIVHSE